MRRRNEPGLPVAGLVAAAFASLEQRSAVLAGNALTLFTLMTWSLSTTMLHLAHRGPG